MKKILVLTLALLLLLGCSARAEDYSAYTLEELKAMRDAIDSEIQLRIQQAAAESQAISASPEDFIYVDNGEEVMIRGYKGTDANVVIPAEIGGLPVTRIAESAFSENNTIVSVVMPDSVTEIGARAFYNCKSLVSVKLSSGVTEIKDNTFRYDDKLVDINLDHITHFATGALAYTGLAGVITLRGENLIIDMEAFRYARITGVKIYADTVQINNTYAFTNMDSLRFFFVSDDAKLYINGKIMSYCPQMEAFIAPAATQVNYSKDDLFANCPKLTIYTPAASGLAAYAKEQFIRCQPDEYEAMSALYDAAEQ